MNDTSPKIELLAAAAHMANRAYCTGLGDFSQLPWSEAADWQKESCHNGVAGVLNGNGPEESHKSWLAHKEKEGWTYGPEKDAEKKTHPCFVPYDELPDEQKAKDALFVATVRSVAAVYEDCG